MLAKASQKSCASCVLLVYSSMKRLPLMSTQMALAYVMEH